MFGHGMHWGWGMGFSWLLALAVIILIVWIVTKGISAGQYTTPENDKSALDILKERYARGEINKEEFEEKKHVIS